ncbi:hypothetical protein [Actinomyces sp.]|uniref:hypothetical protein n=1 Tax=Actinomyces sp. TaxID=29317 RepID=UPI0026DC8BDB|nr:hypothetical protein [Actinomyces sp.]MDO4901224.1 hypothetical protein [Actinomyces sp.]
MSACAAMQRDLARLACLGALLAALGACSAGGSALPATTPIPAATVQTKTADANGITLQVPSTWVSHLHTVSTTENDTDDDPWSLHMTDPDGDSAPVLAISDVLRTASGEQAYQAASALLSSSITGYRLTGAFTFPTPAHSDAPQVPTPTPTSTQETTAVPDDAAEPTPSSSAAPAPMAETVARIAFAYERGEVHTSGTAWIVPAEEGYVVVVLLDDDDSIRTAIEASLTGGGT